MRHESAVGHSLSFEPHQVKHRCNIIHTNSSCCTVGISLEREGIVACGFHSDGKEGINAFLEKRKPEFNKHL